MTCLRALCATALLLAAVPATAAASRTQESMFQDDPALVSPTASAERVNATLDKLEEIGADRLRISVFWGNIAPATDAAQRPAFDSTNPAAYPAKNWEPIDRVVIGALARGLKVNLNITSPGPVWGMTPSPRADLRTVHGPDPVQFGQFVQAVGTRYNGTYAGLPRVDFWSIWNEPNQGAWLAPQWAPNPARPSQLVEAAPHLYRNLTQTAYAGLRNSGHGQDTILVGETAPAGTGTKDRGISRSVDALRFVRQMYCLDDNLQIIKGSAAQARNCPGQGKAFVDANPALFKTAGYAHHPYAFFTSPRRKPRSDDHVTMGNLRDLQRELRRIYARYEHKTQVSAGVPTWLTEFGYQTKPDPLGISMARASAYMNEAEYIAYNNSLVRSVSQFLLNDDLPVAGAKSSRDKWLTFQSGLRTAQGKNKPLMKAYVTPIHLSSQSVRRGRTTRVWGKLRPAAGPGTESARIQFRRRGSKRWSTVARQTAKPPHFHVSRRVRIRRSGAMRILWYDGTKATASRAVSVRARAR